MQILTSLGWGSESCCWPEAHTLHGETFKSTCHTEVCSFYNTAGFIRQEPDLPPAVGAEGQKDARCAELRGWASFP